MNLKCHHPTPFCLCGFDLYYIRVKSIFLLNRFEYVDQFLKTVRDRCFKGKNIKHQGIINARIEGINEGVRSMYFSVS